MGLVTLCEAQEEFDRALDRAVLELMDFTIDPVRQVGPSPAVQAVGAIVDELLSARRGKRGGPATRPGGPS